MSKSVTSRIVVDIEEPKCRNPHVVPAGRSLRSTIRADRMKHQPVHQVITSVGEIPGERIIYDGEKGQVFIEDRLGYPEAKALREELVRLARSTMGIIDPAASGGPRPTETYNMHTNDDRATWLMALVQLYESGAIVVVEGTLPTRAEVDNVGEWTKCPFFGFQDQKVYRKKRAAKEKVGA